MMDDTISVALLPVIVQLSLHLHHLVLLTELSA